MDFYSLEMILAIGYRVRSHRGVQFRRWATERLREYMVKGFVLDDQRLKGEKEAFGADYFDELLERIRDIRASEKRFYQKVREIYTLSCSSTREPFWSTAARYQWMRPNAWPWSSTWLSIRGESKRETPRQRRNLSRRSKGCFRKRRKTANEPTESHRVQICIQFCFRQPARISSPEKQPLQLAFVYGHHHRPTVRAGERILAEEQIIEEAFHLNCSQLMPGFYRAPAG